LGGGFFFIKTLNFKLSIYLLVVLFLLPEISAQDLEPKDSLIGASNWGLSINPTSILNYIGNAGEADPPVWTGFGDDQINVSYVKTRGDNRMLRYEIGLYASDSRLIESVQSLDVNGNPLNGEFVEDNYNWRSFSIGLRLLDEYFIGENRLRGRYGYFSGFALSKQDFNYLSQNPLETLVGDTLFFSPGRTFSFQSGLLSGVSYFFKENIFLSGDMDLSFTIRDTRNSVLRQVAIDPLITNGPFISENRGEERISDWNLGIRFRPTLRLTFIF